MTIPNLEIDEGPPQARDVVLPRLSRDLEHAEIVRWFVSNGDRVAEGDVLAEVAAGNVTMEIEAGDDGIVEVLLVPAGQVAVGSVIARISAAEPEAQAHASSLTDGARAPIDSVELQHSTEAARLAAAPSSELTYADALRAALAAAMQRDPDVFVIGESVADFGRCSLVVKGLAEQFGPNRVVGTPITPHAVVGLAVGAAMAGLRPVVEVTAWSLALQAIDPIVSSAAKTRYRSGGMQGVPLVLRGRNGAWPSTGAMHSMNLAAWLAHIPGLKVVCPATPACAKGLLAAAIDDPDPVIVLETDALYESTAPVPDADDFSVPIGQARVAHEGSDVTAVTYGGGVATALAAAAMAAQSNVSVEVIDLRTVRPIDLAAIVASVTKTGRLLTLDDDWPHGGIGAEVCASVATTAFTALKRAPVRLGWADTPVPYAPNLEALVQPDAEEVAAKLVRLAGA